VLERSPEFLGGMPHIAALIVKAALQAFVLLALMLFRLPAPDFIFLQVTAMTSHLRHSPLTPYPPPPILSLPQ
jgi:hypothetical protein